MSRKLELKPLPMEAGRKERMEGVVICSEQGWQGDSVEGADRTHTGLWICMSILPAGSCVPLSKLAHFSELMLPLLQKGIGVPLSWCCFRVKDPACKRACPHNQ